MKISELDRRVEPKLTGLTKLGSLKPINIIKPRLVWLTYVSV